MDSHPIRNGIIATVVGGVILTFVVPNLRELSLQALDWILSGFTWLWQLLIATYSIPGWVLLFFGSIALVGLLALFMLLKELVAPEHRKYNEDFFHGAKWRWSWAHGKISNLWCYCPDCDAELVYSDNTEFPFEPPETKFICEHCNQKVVTAIKGGNKYYAQNLIKREINRKIRTSKI